MARLATLALLLLSLLAVLEAESAISDDQGPPNPVLLTQDDQAEAAAEVIHPRLSTPAVGGGEAMLRLPSHRRPCNLHRHLWWARHRGLSHHRAAFSGPGEARVRPAVVPTELAHVEEQEPTEAELVAVAEPDPDSRLDTDAEQTVAEPDPDSRPDTDAEQTPFHGEEEGDAAKAWKVEMLRRFRHGIRFHHRHHHEHDHDREEHEDQEQVKDEGDNMKLFGRFHHRHHLRHHHEHEEDDEHKQEDKDEGINMKLFRRFHHHQHHGHDSDGEVDEVEELARRLSEAIMRRRASHGGHHQHHHHHGAAESGVKKWFKGLMNRF